MTFTINDTAWEGLKDITSENFVESYKADLEKVVGYVMDGVVKGTFTTTETTQTGLQNVKPGQLITADFMNTLIDKVNELSQKVTALEKANQ